MDVSLRIDHLFEHPSHLSTVAGWIYREFWSDREGYEIATFERLLRAACDPDRVPISRLALVAGRPAGTVNLVHVDSETRPDLHPWLAALFVAPEFRRRGVGSALVTCLVGDAIRLGFGELFLGTDIPAFYRRLGAEVYQIVSGEMCIMRVDLARRAGARGPDGKAS